MCVARWSRSDRYNDDWLSREGGALVDSGTYPRPGETTPKLALLERFMPWMAKKHISRGFVSLVNLAIYAGAAEKLPTERAALWSAIVWMAEDICHQLFVENPHPSLDFGLKKHWRRLAM